MELPRPWTSLITFDPNERFIRWNELVRLFFFDATFSYFGFSGASMSAISLFYPRLAGVEVCSACYRRERDHRSHDKRRDNL